MQAVTCPRYGSPDVLEVREVPDPVLRPGHVIVEIRAASVNALDWRVVTAQPALARLMFGLRRPSRVKIMGADLAGVVASVADDVRGFAPGDEVYGEISPLGYGGFSELGLIRAEHMALKPRSMGFEEAAAVPVAGLTALQSLRDWGKLHAGQHVLVTGASGGVGSYAVQIAKALGARVSALTSPGKLDMVKALGADRVVDRTEGDWTQSSTKYDMILDVGARRPLRETRRALAPEGTLVFVGGDARYFAESAIRAPLAFLGSRQRFVSGNAKASGQDLATLAQMIDAGKVKSVIDRRYTMREAAAAVAHVASGEAQGKTVITIGAR